MSMEWNRPTCQCGRWRWWEEPQRWLHIEGFTVNRGLCFDCNCRLERDGTVTPMVEAADSEPKPVIEDLDKELVNARLRRLEFDYRNLVKLLHLDAQLEEQQCEQGEKPDVSVERWRRTILRIPSEEETKGALIYATWRDQQEAHEHG